MDNKFLEIFELKYKKIINSSQIMYKTLASYREMAFSLKKMCKEADCYVQALIVLSLINSNELTIEILNQLENVSEYDYVFKKIKLRKVTYLDEKYILKIKNICIETLKIDPLFIKVASFFDSIVSKLDGVDKISGCAIIEDCLLSILLLVRNIDEDNNNKQYQKDIEIIYKYIKR